MRALALALSVSLVAPSIARAEPSPTELAVARKQFEQGIEREKAGDWAEALALFREVARVKANHIVRFHVALCLEKTGKLVDAFGEFAAAKAQAEHDGGTDAELTITNANKHVASLRARIPSVRIAKPDVAATITVDGAPIATALLGTAIPLDPGTHAIEARADGREPFSAKVTLVEGNTQPVEIVPVLAPSPVEPKKAHEAYVAPQASSPWPWIVGSVGVAALAGAGTFYLLRSSTLSDLDATCDASRANCDPAKRSLDDRGRTYTTAGNVLLGVGAGALVAASVLLVVDRSGERRVAIGPGRIAFVGTF